MPIQTIVSIEIEGEKINKFSRFVLEQKVNAHHKFAVVIPISFEGMKSAMTQAQSYVGGKILVTISPAHFSTGETLQFRGIVSETKLIKGDGASAGILINGFSTTFQMEGLPDTMSFNDKKFSQIANEILARYPQDRLEPKVNLENDDTIPYTVQYMESDFQFLSRMASKKAVWFYYNGRELILGKPESKNIDLVYGSGLNTFNFEMRAKPVKFAYYGYDASEAKNETVNSEEVTPSLNTLSENLLQNSKKMFPSVANMLYNNPIREGELKNHLSSRIKSQVLSQTSDLLTVSGNSDNSSIRIGDIVKISDPGFSVSSLEDGIRTPQDFGSFYVTDLMHICDESGNYYNEFRGISSDAECPPYGNVHNIANAEIQSAIVIDNNDPKGLSRITVQFPWQQVNGSTTPWTRVTTPYAGNGKGFHVVPEIGEEVLVEFEGGNPEKPVVIGAMFHGQGKSGLGGAGNYIKGFQTPTGNKLQLNDQDGSVLMTDKGTCHWKMDGAGNMSSGADASITLTVGGTEESPDGSSKLFMDSNGNITIDGKESLKITIGKSSLEMLKDGTIKINGKDISILGENSLLGGTKLATVGSSGEGEVHVTGGKMVQVKGTQVDIN